MAKIVITGAASGIGRAAVDHFVAEGQTVVGLDLNDALLGQCPTQSRAVDVRVSVPLVLVTHLRTPFAAMWTRSPYGAIMCV